MPAELREIPLEQEVELLREALAIYGDRPRMATSCRPVLQQVIDLALEAMAGRVQPSAFASSHYVGVPVGELLQELRPMASAPRDRTIILGFTRDDLPEEENLAWSPHRWRGRCVPMWHEGKTPSDFDLGWSVALPVGHGGLPDLWFRGWLPRPEVCDPETIR